MKYILEQIRIFLFGKEQNTAKKIVNWSFILLLVAALIDYGIANDGDMTGLLKKETWQEIPNKTEPIKNDTIFIKPLGKIKQSKLEEASKVISQKFNVNTKIVDIVNLEKNMFYQNTDKINPYTTLNFLQKRNTIIITDYKMTESDTITTVMGLEQNNSILVSTFSPFKETLIHEFGHKLGLSHCEDSHCIMSTFSNGYQVKYGINFCKNCKSKINL